MLKMGWRRGRSVKSSKTNSNYGTSSNFSNMLCEILLELYLFSNQIEHNCVTLDLLKAYSHKKKRLGAHQDHS